MIQGQIATIILMLAGLQNALFDELAEKVSDESLGRDETYVCKANHMIMYCETLNFN